MLDLDASLVLRMAARSHFRAAQSMTRCLCRCSKWMRIGSPAKASPPNNHGAAKETPRISNERISYTGTLVSTLLHPKVAWPTVRRPLVILSLSYRLSSTKILSKIDPRARPFDEFIIDVHRSTSQLKLSQVGPEFLHVGRPNRPSSARQGHPQDLRAPRTW